MYDLKIEYILLSTICILDMLYRSLLIHYDIQLVSVDMPTISGGDIREEEIEDASTSMDIIIPLNNCVS